MTKKELQEIITNGESSKVEFTRDETTPQELAKEIVALVNFQGGMILLGVADNKSILGIKRERLEEWIMEICRSNIEPSIIPFYEEVVVEDKKVAIINLIYTQDKPYSAIEKGRRIYYIRVGTTSRVATREEMRRLYQTGGLLYYEATAIISSSTEESLNLPKIFEFYKNYQGRNLGDLTKLELNRFLSNAGLLSESPDGKVYPTVAGVLIFGNEPEQHLFQTGITFCAFLGEKITDELFDRKVFTATLKENIDNCCDLIRNILPNYPEIIGLERKEKEVYPYKVIREAIVNALVHRDYTIKSKVRVFLFKDRLEIKSPGRLPNGVTIDQMKVGISEHRNPTLTKFMSYYHYMEYAGRGIPLILETMKSLGAKEPQILENSETTLKIFKRE